MAQSSTVNALPTPPIPNPDVAEGSFSPVPEVDIIAALSNSGGSFPALTVDLDFTSSGSVFLINIGLETLSDPGVNSDHVLHITVNTLRDFGFIPRDVILNVDLCAPANPANAIVHWDTTLIAANSWSGSFYTGPDITSPLVIDLPLLDAEVDTFRAASGYTDFGVFISIFALGAGDLIQAEFDFIEFTCPASGGGVPLVITGSGGFIFGGQGLGLDYFVPDGGFIFGGGGNSVLYFDPLEYTAEGGFIFGGSAGIGGNQITGTGGFILGGGGRDFMILSPDIGGIYFLDFLATHDTFYLRDGFQGTEDVKIPDPFIQTAYLGD